METSILKKWLGLTFILIGSIWIFKLFQIEKISNLPMGSYHTWRQADCISMTYEFYNGKATLLNPTTYYTKADGTRLAAGEFPIMNKLVAIIFKITSPSLKTYRYTVYFFYIIGIFFLYLLFFELSGLPINSALFTLLLGNGSILVFYSINFLPDVPALSMGTTGLYFWLIARKKKKILIYGLSVFILTLASLIKLTMMLLMGAFTLVILAEMFLHARRNFHFPVLLFILSGTLIIIGWYYHAYALDHSHQPWIFLTETRSYFKTYYLEKPIVWDDIKNKWLPQVFIKPVWYFIMGAGLFVIIFSKKVLVEHKLLTGSVIVGALFFCMMMYRQFMHHDYLWICLLIVPILMGAVTLEAIGRSNKKYFKYIISCVIFILFIFQAKHTQEILSERYFAIDNSIFYNSRLIGLKDQLRKNGIEKTDLVLSVPDPSPNITLTIMDQYGFTLYREDKKTEESIRKKIKAGAKYLVVSNPAVFNEPYVLPFISDTVFHYEDIWVYNLTK